MNRKSLKMSLSVLLLGGLIFSFASCGTKTNNDEGEEQVADSMMRADEDVPTGEYTVDDGTLHHTYLLADQEDQKHIYKETADKSKCFIVISKKEYRLYVYEAASDTSLVASFPICYAIKPEAKTMANDNCTPECTMQNPFHVMRIDDASAWFFDFGDGRGSILAFGNWFIRLDLSQSFPDNPTLAANTSIGIHGSTGNVVSIPGRDSHGCVRMLDDDLNTLHDNYVQEGTPVIIKNINENKYPFEVSAQNALGDKYVAPKRGNHNLVQQSKTHAKAHSKSHNQSDEEYTDEYDESDEEYDEAVTSSDGQVVGTGSGQTSAAGAY